MIKDRTVDYRQQNTGAIERLNFELWEVHRWEAVALY